MAEIWVKWILKDPEISPLVQTLLTRNLWNVPIFFFKMK